MKKKITRLATALALVASALTGMIVSSPNAAAATMGVQPRKVAVVIMENKGWTNIAGCTSTTKWNDPYLCSARGVSDGVAGLTSSAFIVPKYSQANLNTSGSMSNGSATLTISQAKFSSTDCTNGTGCTGSVDKWVAVPGAGAGANVLVSPIVAYTSTTVVTLRDAASATVSGANILCDGCANNPALTSGGMLAGTSGAWETSDDDSAGFDGADGLQRTYDNGGSGHYNAIVGSAGNYAAMFTGNDCNPSGNSADAANSSSDAFYATDPQDAIGSDQTGNGHAGAGNACGNSLFQLLNNASVTWKDYAEGFGGSVSCTGSRSDLGDATGDTSNVYVRRHNPGAMLADASSDPHSTTGCTGNMVNWPSADTGDQHKTINDDGGAFSAISPALPSLSIVVPDNCHDMHTGVLNFPPYSSTTQGCVNGSATSPAP